MKTHELLSFNKEFLQKLHTAGIKINDYKYVELYEDYRQLNHRGEKKTYIVAFLSSKYNLSERHTYSVISRLEQDINSGY